MIEDLQLRVARDHLLQCQHRLAVARRAQANTFGIVQAFSIMDRWEREAEFLRALDFVWEAQGRQNLRPQSPNALTYYPCGPCKITWVLFRHDAPRPCPRCGADLTPFPDMP